MRRGKQKVRLSTSVTEIGKNNDVKVVRMTKRKNAGRSKPKAAEKDPLALPKRQTKSVPTKAARKQPAEPEEYEVEKIVGHQYIGRKVSFCIRWKGWAAKHDTWQFEDDLNCAMILKAYKATMDAKKTAASPKKLGRPSLNKSKTSSPKKKTGVASGRVTKAKATGKGRGRPKGKTATASPAKKKASKKKSGKADKEWEVEEVVSVRTTGDGQEEFYIKWKGYSSDENTWEPAENVSNCDAAIERFRQTQGDDQPKNGMSTDEDVDKAAGDGTATEGEEEEEDQTTKDTAADDEDDTQKEAEHD